MGFTRRAVGTEGTAPNAHAPAATWQDCEVEASTSVGVAPSIAGLEPRIMAANGLWIAPSTGIQNSFYL